MDNKKFKILAIVDAVIIVALIVLMMVLKGNYNDQAQASVKEQVGAFQESANGVLQELWKSVDQNGMAWKLVYATITGDKTEKSFNAAVKASADGGTMSAMDTGHERLLELVGAVRESMKCMTGEKREEGR